MKKTRSKVLCAIAALLGVFFVFACVAGFAACGDGEPETYRFEAEDAKLDGDESEMLYWLDNEVYQGSYITGFGFIFDVQEDETASGGESVGYLAHNNPTATFTINSKKAVSGATLTLRAASCDVNAEGISSVYGLMVAGINSYSGADHNILSVNGQSVALSGTLEGSESVFSTDGLAMSNWGTLTATIDLVKGDNTIVLTHDGAGVNWDYIEIESTAALSMDKADNSGFTVDKDNYVPDEGGDDTQGGGTGSYDNTLSIEAEDAGLFNSMESTASSTTLIGTEETTVDGTKITNVKNFNTAGDKIVFQVLASAAIDDVAISITACNGGTFADNDKILTVNGGDPIALTGTLTNTAFDWSSYGILTGTISLDKGINYIEITAAATSATGYLNVDKIDLSWDGTATITAQNDYVGKVFDVDETGAATLEAEDASLMNAVGVSGSTSLLGTEVSSSAGVTQVKNFNEIGDEIVFQINAAAALNNVSLEAFVNPTTGTFDVAEHASFIKVNGEAVELTNTDKLASNAYSALTATFNLEKGINYIEIISDTSGMTSIPVIGDMNVGFMNVDRIDLNGGTGAEAEPEEISRVFVPSDTFTFNNETFNGFSGADSFTDGNDVLHDGISVAETETDDGTSIVIDGVVANVMSDAQKTAFDESYSSDDGVIRFYVAFEIAVNPSETVAWTSGEKTETVSNSGDETIYIVIVEEVANPSGNGWDSSSTSAPSRDYGVVSIPTFSLSIEVTDKDNNEASYVVTFGDILLPKTAWNCADD